MRHGQTWACAAEPIFGQAHANFQHKIFNDNQDTRNFQIKKKGLKNSRALTLSSYYCYVFKACDLLTSEIVFNSLITA